MQVLEYFVIYNHENGDYHGKGTGPIGSAAYQQLPSQYSVLEMPQDAFLALPDDFGPLKTAIINSVNINAAIFRSRYITSTTGQSLVYAQKEDEARRWNGETDLSDFPFLREEAEATDVSVADLVQKILEKADAWRQLSAKIEGRRQKAIMEVNASVNFKELVAASVFDWNEVAPPPTS